MGACVSRGSPVCDTAKLILPDGRLEEFPLPMKVSHVLRKSPGCFVCNCDDMQFDRVASAIDGEDELQLGQIYFVLPVSWLKRPLQAEEMAKLAVKASSALVKTGGGALYVLHKKQEPPNRPSGEDVRGKACGDGGRRLAATRLNAIPEQVGF